MTSSSSPPSEPAAPSPTASQRVRAYSVHVYTASGVVMALLAAMETCAPRPDPRRVFLWLFLAVLIDASDGPLARAWNVKKWAPRIDGRTIDDIVDYLTYTFLPLLLVWRMGWLPEPATLWLAPALIASLFGFSNAGAKDEEGGFFLGFPSYWNVIAVYAGVFFEMFGPWINAAALLFLALLTVLPVRFVYPNLAPRPWKLPVIVGAALWGAMLVGIIVRYPSPPEWLVWASLVYPAFYVAISWHLGRRPRG